MGTYKKSYRKENLIQFFFPKRIIFFIYLIFTVLPSKATILKFNCESTLDFNINYKINVGFINNKNSYNRSRPIFSENKKPKNFIVTHDLETGNGYIDGNVYIDGKLKSVIAGEDLLFKSESIKNDSQKVGSIIKEKNSKSESFSLIIDDYKNANEYIGQTNYKYSSEFSLHKKIVLRNSKRNTEENTYEKESEFSHEISYGRCKM